MPAIRPLRRLQVGLEATPGTAVSATRVLRGTGRVTERAPRYVTDHLHGVRAAPGGASVITRRWTDWEIESELTLEEIGWFLQTGIASVTPTGSADPYTWTWEPALGSGGLSIATMSVEFVETDGATNLLTVAASYGHTQQIDIEVPTEGVATIKASGQARARQATAPSGTATPVAQRTLLPGPLWRCAWDTSWATIGTTQLASAVRAAKLSVKTGWAPAWTLDARADLDWANLEPGLVEVDGELELELTAVAAARIANWRANDRAFVRIEASPSANRQIQIDLSAELDDDLRFGEDGEVTTVAMKLRGVYDATSAMMLRITARNGSATL